MPSLPRILQSSLGRDTGSMLLGQGGRVLIQAGYFVVVARELGASGFGGFAGVVAVIALIAPLASLGALNLLIRNTVRDRDAAPSQYALALALVAITGVILLPALLGLRQLVATVPISVLLCIAVADLFGSRANEVTAALYQATDRMPLAARTVLWLQVARAAGAVVLAISPIAFTLRSWSLVYAGSTLVPCLVTVWLAVRREGLSRPNWAGYRRDWRLGLLFSVGLSSQSVYNDVDKAMLAKLSTLEATGIYTAAYRLVDMAFIPMRALLSATYPRFMAEGAHGVIRTAALTRRLLAPGVGYCAVASAALFFGANLVPIVLGADYESSVGALRALAVLPLLKILHYLPADALTGAEMQGHRTVVQIVVAALNVALNVTLIPVYGLWGAIWASIGADALLAAAMWAILGVKVRTARRPDPSAG